MVAALLLCLSDLIYSCRVRSVVSGVKGFLFAPSRHNNRGSLQSVRED